MRQQGLLPSASDYVCVLDVDLLELVIKTWKGSAEDKLVSVAVAPGPPGRAGLGAREPSGVTLS